MLGVDFHDDAKVREVLLELTERVPDGYKLMVHFAPPCSTFSTVRNRFDATRLRSCEYSQGLDADNEQRERANRIAFNTLWAARYLGENL